MRLLRLDLGPGSPSIDLHPFVTVISGLDEARRDQVIDAVRRLAQGSTNSIYGLVQHQGLLFELDGLGRDLIPPVTGADVVVDCGPGGGIGRAALLAQLDQQQRQVEIDAVAVEEIRADIDTAASARVATIERSLAPPDPENLRRTETLEELGAAMAALADVDPVVVEVPPAAGQLRRRLEEHMTKAAGAEPHFERLFQAIQQAETRVEHARQAATEAEGAAEPALLDREEEARLEQLSFPEMDDSRRGKWRKSLRPDEEAEKQALLDKVGVQSWTAYTVHRMDPAPLPARLEAKARARRQLVEAEADLERARDELVADPLTADLNDEMDAIQAEARELLGEAAPPDLARALDGLAVQRDNPAWLDAVDAVRQLLERLGEGDHLTGSSEVVARAAACLDAGEDGPGRPDRASLALELARARHRLDRHRRALRRIGRAEEVAARSAAKLVEIEEQLGTGTGDGPPSAGAVLSLVRPVATRVRQDAGGSLPIVVTGLGRLEGSEVAVLLEGLSQLTDDVQVVVLCDSEAATGWARDAGLDRALASQPGLVRG